MSGLGQALAGPLFLLAALWGGTAETAPAASPPRTMVVASPHVAIAIETPAAAVGDAPDSIVTLRAEAKPSPVKPGGTVTATVTVRIAEGYHLQAHVPRDPSYIPTTLTWTAPRGFRVGRVRHPLAVLRKVEFDPQPLAVYEGAIAITARIVVARTVLPGTYALKGKLRYQACSGEACQAPATAPVALTVRVTR